MFLELPLMIAIAATVFAALIGFVVWRKVRFSAAEVKEPLFSPEYRALLGQIDIAVRSQLMVFPKIPVRDVVVSSGGRLRKFKHQRFDFVLCHRRNMDVLCVVQMIQPGKSDSGIHRLRKLCANAGLTMMEYDVKPYRDVPTLRRDILSACGIDEFESPDSDGEQPCVETHRDAEKAEPLCSKCQSAMTLQTIRKGQHAGKECWVCTRYPECKGARIDH